MTEMITLEELTEALRSVRIWVRQGPEEPVAWKMQVLHPKDTAEDIFVSAQVRRAHAGT